MCFFSSHGDYNADLNPGSRPAYEVVLNPHSTSVGTMGANRGQHWSDTEIAALLDVWGDDKIQTQLNGAYRNDSVLRIPENCGSPGPLLLVVTSEAENSVATN